jgi:hypothetical protein
VRDVLLGRGPLAYLRLLRENLSNTHTRLPGLARDEQSRVADGLERSKQIRAVLKR